MIDLSLSHDGARRPTPSVEWLASPARPALQVSAALDRVRRAPTILAAMREAAEVVSATDSAVHHGIAAASLLAPIMEAIDDGSDTVTALAAIHALGRVPGPGADIELAALILDGIPGYEDHALWAMGSRDPAQELLQPLAQAVASGGLPGMHAQGALARWARTRGRVVLAALESVLAEVTSDDARRYLVETMGLLPLPHAGLRLEAIATDSSESLAVRRTAIAAFAERSAEAIPRGVAALAAHGELGEAVRLARAHRRLSRRGPRRGERRAHGIRVAQIHLAAVLDATSSRSGMGDAGGVATLLSRLGTILADQPRLAEVISVGRSLPDQTSPSTHVAAGRRFEAIPLAAGEGATFAGSWPSVVSAARGIRAAFLADHVPDVVHLRMADPGTLAGALVARQLDVPVVFSLAPDPHGPIATAEAAGTLDRATFAGADARGALWYRANLVERLARDARELVLFPRARLRERLRDLTGIDVVAGAPNHTIVPEGIDTVLAEQAARTIEEAVTTPPIVGDLQQAISDLPVDRHGLPLVVSVGRLHEAKGMARLVETFAIDAELAVKANLVIVGGDLECPSRAEVAELTRIGRLFERYPGLSDRVVLLGHRPNDEVGLVLATARNGWGASIGPHGAYACASPKEEFGLAIIEAMAAGLPVVAPRDGGPATYVEDGRIGRLVDTTDTRALAPAIGAALELARDPASGERSQAIVRERFTLSRMARTLTAIYRIAAGASTLAHPVDVTSERAA